MRHDGVDEERLGEELPISFLQHLRFGVSNADDPLALNQDVASGVLLQERGEVGPKGGHFTIKRHDAPTVRWGRGEKQTMAG